MERLGVNVVSVVIGALFFIIAIAWVEVLRNVVEYVFFHTEGIKNYHNLQKKFLGAVVVTAVSAVLIIIIYCIYKETPTSHKVESESGEVIEPGKGHESVVSTNFPGTLLPVVEPGTGPGTGSDYVGVESGGTNQNDIGEINTDSVSVRN